MELPGIIEFCDEQRVRVRVRVPSAKRTEYEEQPSLLAIGCSSYSYSAQRYSYSLAVRWLSQPMSCFHSSQCWATTGLEPVEP